MAPGGRGGVGGANCSTQERDGELLVIWLICSTDGDERGSEPEHSVALFGFIHVDSTTS